MRAPLFLTLDEVFSLHAEQIRLFGGASGIRDIGLLESAVGSVAATFDGAFLHETVFAMAAAYLEEVKGLQAEWKAIGPVTRGQEKAIWERFRAACDRFFTRRQEDLAKLQLSLRCRALAAIRCSARNGPRLPKL